MRHAQQIGLLNQGLLAALQDKRLNQVLEKILFSPQLDWNIEQLAELASMSRATFMRIFQQQLGMPTRLIAQYSNLIEVKTGFFQELGFNLLSCNAANKP